MTNKEDVNIFLNYQQSNKTNLSSLFSNPIQNNNNYSQRQYQSGTLSKRENFSNEIRKKQKQQIKKNLRSQLIKSMRDDSLFDQLYQMATKNTIESKNLLNFLTDLKKTIDDYDFCKKLAQSQLVKQYLVDLYVSSKQLSTIKQKILLIQSLICLTYYGLSALEHNQKQKLIDAMIIELQKINKWDFQSMDYFKNLLNLLTNITADRDQNFNYYLVDTKIFCLIAEKITEILEQAQKISQQSQDKQIQQKFIDHLTDLRQSFIGTLYNLSQYQNEFFFKFAVNELVNDINYIESFPINVVRIFTNFFKCEKFRLNFFENPELFGWFEYYIPQTCQKRFTDSKSLKTAKLQDLLMSQNEKQLFYQFLCCLMTFVYNQERDCMIETNTLVQQNINLYCLSEFLIQAAGHNDQVYEIRRNSVYVAKAIEIYEYLASDPHKSVSNLLVVTSQRTFQDIIKVFLDKTYFTSCRISDVTLSFLNKIISKNSEMLKTFMELRILESIDYFLEGNIEIQTQQQIINFLELLTFMIISEDEISKKDRRTNQIIRLLEMRGVINRIQKYQDHQEKQVSDKAQAFLSHIESYRQ